jgi:OmpA-OmpF porin, OOP family
MVRRVVASLIFLYANPAVAAEVDCNGWRTDQGYIYFEPFIIFFDWDSAAITPSAAAILDNAARYHREIRDCAIIITGHTDRSGSEVYNAMLSRRRAESVGAYLRRRGLTAEIRLEPFGETRPLVETPDGMHEPQNRRSEIVVGPRGR